ncbi:MAG: hypothetical protein HC769_00495 [Cyanobacteria bacterium CRU_2_1]|nr:hypothetical protein [Cyanobacteria bacterium RU_5_0]NJR57451.1 hypothetical protein [Cyanobacteria bacterium CRU_2_1]
MVQESQQHSVMSSASGQHPNRWWQWVIMYPALFLSLVGNIPHIPNLVTAFQQGVPPNIAQEMREQAQLWEKNMKCLGQQRSVAESQADELAISVTLCPTGDMLVSIDDADPQNIKSVKLIRHWVEFNAQSENPFSNILIPSAIAATLDNPPQSDYPLNTSTELAQVTVVCQKSLGEGRILRRLRHEDGSCFDEVVNTFTGEVISQTAAPQCSADCSGG